MRIEKNQNSESRMIFILCFLGLVFGILVFSVMLSNNILRERNLRLNEYVIQNCGVVRSETTFYKITVAKYATSENINVVLEKITQGVDYIFDKIEESEK